MISVKGLCLSFGPKQIFNDFNYEFELGKIYTIMGKSGCGKTTLLRIIAGLQSFDKGEVLCRGEKVRPSMKDLFMMHQAYVNFPWKTCLKNVTLPLWLNDGKLGLDEIQAAKQMLIEVGLPDSENLYPYELSGGMKQRLALARVLVSKPSVILMDEPLSALDPATRCKMQDLILNLHRETNNTIIMVTHDPAEAMKMQDVAINL